MIPHDCDLSRLAPASAPLGVTVSALTFGRTAIGPASTALLTCFGSPMACYGTPLSMSVVTDETPMAPGDKGKKDVKVK